MNNKFEEWFNYEIPREVIKLPKIIISVNAEGSWPRLLDEITKVTKEYPSRWPEKPWYDQTGLGDFPFPNGQLSHSNWANIYNQKQLRECELPRLLVPSNIPEELLHNLPPFHSEKELIRELPKYCQITGWVLLALHEDWVCFATISKNRTYVHLIQKWANNENIPNFSQEFPPLEGNV